MCCIHYIHVGLTDTKAIQKNINGLHTNTLGLNGKVHDVTNLICSTAET